MGSNSLQRYHLIISPLDVGFQILIASSGKVDDDEVVWIEGDLVQGMDGMGRLDGGNDSLRTAQQDACLHRILILNPNKLRPSHCM